MGLMYERKYGHMKKPKLSSDPVDLFRPPKLPQQKLRRFAIPINRPPNQKVCPECGKILDISQDPDALDKHMNEKHPEYIYVRGRYHKLR